YTIEFQQLNFAKTVLFSGHISESTTWSTDILIKGDVWVDLGVTLTIDAGVNVKFIPNFDNEHAGIDTTRAEFIIHGSLVLIGNDSLPTTFTSNSPHPEIGDWYGIRFIEPESKGIQERDFAKPTDDKRADIDFEPVEKEMEFLTGEASSLTKAEVRQDALPVVDNAADGDFVFTENEFIVEIRRERQRSDEKKDTRRRRNIHYLEIEYAKTGLTLCEGKMLYMKDCAFKNNEMGLKLTGKSNVSVTNSVFEDNTIYGIFIGEGVTGDIKDCTVSLNSTGIIFSGNTSSKAKELDIEEDNTGGNVSNISNLSIRHSRIINNYDYGIYITNDAEPDLGGRGHNYIYGSGMFDLYNNTDSKIMAKKNYWGTKDTDTVKEHIYDYYDDNSLGIVEVEPLWEGEDEKGKGGEMTSGEGRTPLIYSLKH
ncbi:right-handed parallel beta-helix repeat-containing protein, partial [candidate division WOR-3 bacterium]|nr:right-handed parallel beta-helix repeat-containing protein [candidate division WOR-3 bacterium]